QCQGRRDLVIVLNEKLRLNLPHGDDRAIRSLPGVYLPEQEIGITDTRFAGSPRTGRIERTLLREHPAEGEIARGDVAPWSVIVLHVKQLGAEVQNVLAPDHGQRIRGVE